MEDVCSVPHQPGQFAIASRNGKIGIVDVVTKKLLRTMDTEDAGDIRIAISGDGTLLLSRTGIAPRGHLFETATGKRLHTLNLGNYRAKPATKFNHSIAINEDGTLGVFLFPFIKELRLVELETGKLRWTRISNAKQMLFHPDGKRLFVARHIEPLEIVNVSNGQALETQEFPVLAQSLSLSTDGRLIAATLLNGEVAVYAGPAHTPIMRKMEDVPVHQLAFTGANNLLFVKSRPGQPEPGPALALFNPLQATLLGLFMGLVDHPENLPLRINIDSGHLLTLQSPPQLWRFIDTPLASLPLPTAVSRGSFEFLSDSVLVARKGQGLDLYDVSDPRAPTAMETELAANHGIVAIHRGSGKFATALAPVERTLNNASLVQLQKWAPDGSTMKWSLPEEKPGDTTMELQFDSTGERLLRVRLQKPHQVLSAKTGEVLSELPIPMHRAAFAGSQDWIVAIPQPTDGQPGSVKLVDPSTGEIRATANSPVPPSTLAVSADSKLVGVAGGSQSVRILDADTLEEKYHFYAHEDIISTLRFHPTRPIIATGSVDHTVKLWNYETEKLVQTLLGFNGRPLHLAFSPNGRLLAVEGMEHEMHIFEIEDDAE